ncbi:MAG: hypothetical protein P4L64_06465 [Caulobacteraceae bacterium]|nr:hypothetical protein [Caulobacteraceae bacterium]
MSDPAEHHLELLKLSEPLHRYARDLEDDANAAFLLVHKALAAAFIHAPDIRPDQSLEGALRARIDRAFCEATC